MMNKAIKEEASEQLKKEIRFGFYNGEDLYDSIRDMFYDIEDFDESWLKDEIQERLNKHSAESLTWKRPTDFEKLVNAFDELNKEGIVSLHNAGYTRQDGESDCMEIIDELNALGLQTKGYCYYHAQDLERAIDEEKILFLGYDSHNGEDELAKEVAHTIVSVVRKNGFNVNWNGSINNRIEILDINWKKVVDNVDYNYNRVFDIIKANSNFKNTNDQKKASKPFWKFW